MSRHGECPICYNFGTQYFLCCNGHTICGGCFSKLQQKTCPTCVGIYHNPPTRNRALEEIVFSESSEESSLKISSRPCNNGPLPPDGHEYHNNFISFAHSAAAAYKNRKKKVPCPKYNCPDGMIPLKALEQHMREKHADVAKPVALNEWNTFYWDALLKPNPLNCSHWILTIVPFDGETLYARMEINKEENEMCTWLYVESEEAAKRYRVQITITGPSGNLIQFSGGVFSLHTPKEVVYKSRDCLTLSKGMIEKMKVPSSTSHVYREMLKMKFRMSKK